MVILSKITHPSAVDYFKELPFYNKPIEKPKIKRLKNTDQLAELPFYEQLSIIKTNEAFREYAISYKVEMIERKDPIVQLEASKSSIKELFGDILNETKVFKYQITVKVSLKKYKRNEEIEFAPIYFNSTTKTIINHKFNLKILFKKFYTWLMLGLIKDLAEFMNQLSHNTLIFQLIDHYQEVITWTCLLN